MLAHLFRYDGAMARGLAEFFVVSNLLLNRRRLIASGRLPCLLIAFRFIAKRATEEMDA